MMTQIDLHNRYVVDIRRHRGDSNFIIHLVRDLCSPGATVEWLVRPDQAHLLPPTEIIGESDPVNIQWASTIRDRVIEYAQGDGVGGSLWVLSYDNVLLGMMERLSATHGSVRVRHLADVIRTASTQQRAYRAFPFSKSGNPPPAGAVGSDSTAQGSLPLAEAIELAKQVLRAGSHLSRESALPQKDLRIRMVGVNTLARKSFADAGSATLITDVVDEGLQQGWLKRFRRVPEKTGTEALYLVEAQVPDVAAPIQQITATGSDNTVRQKHQTREKHPTQATAFEGHLQQSRIGSMPETRELLFDAAESIFSEKDDGTNPLLPELFADVTRRAQAEAEKRGYSAEKNWGVASKCVQRLMLWAKVLIAENGKPIEDRIGCNSSRVAKLAPNFRRTCEGFMAAHIIEKMNGISYDDDPYYLGLTLYRRGLERAVSAEDLKVKADEILAYLVEQGKIEMDGDRQIRACPQPGAVGSNS